MRHILFTPIAFIVLFVLLIPGMAIAQANGGTADNGSAIQIEYTPRQPEPGEQVTVVAWSETLDLEDANFTWYRNGTLEQEGRNASTFSFIAEEVGSPSTIEVLVTPEGGEQRGPVSVSISSFPQQDDDEGGGTGFNGNLPGTSGTQTQGVDLLQQLPSMGEMEKRSARRSVEADITPEHPGPHETVTIDTTSYLFDTNRSRFTWYVNGRVRQQGYSQSSFSFTTGAPGTRTSIRVDIGTPEGQTITKTFSFRPAEVSLLWEADTYTPPLYEGRSRVSAESTVTVVARPNIINANGQPLSRDRLVYEWTYEGDPLTRQSGHGRSTIEVTAPKPSGDMDIEVEISTLNGDVVAAEEISIPVADTQLHVYEEDPLAGVMYNHALTDTVEREQAEMTVRAVPYYFSPRATTYEWRMNNTQEGTGRSFTVQGQGQETVSLEVFALNSERTFQLNERSIIFDLTSPQGTIGQE